LEMAAAYCTFANGGYRVTPFAIREILSDSDVVIEQNGPQISQGLPGDGGHDALSSPTGG